LRLCIKRLLSVGQAKKVYQTANARTKIYSELQARKAMKEAFPVRPAIPQVFYGFATKFQVFLLKL